MMRWVMALGGKRDKGASYLVVHVANRARATEFSDSMSRDRASGGLAMMRGALGSCMLGPGCSDVVMSRLRTPRKPVRGATPAVDVDISPP